MTSDHEAAWAPKWFGMAYKNYQPPTCCGEVCGWAERASVWVCDLNIGHRYNDDGVRVNDEGHTEWEAQIAAARRANPSRLLG